MNPDILVGSGISLTILSLFREAAKNGIFLSGPATMRGGGGIPFFEALKKILERNFVVTKPELGEG